MCLSSGDADPCVPYIGTMRWIQSLNLPVASTWKPWMSGSELAGYATRYSTGEKGGYFDFVTIRNAGHMVPRYNSPFPFSRLCLSFSHALTHKHS